MRFLLNQMAVMGLSLLFLTQCAKQPNPVTYGFTVEVTEGSLAGNTFTGEISYDESALTGRGQEILRWEDGLTVRMTMLGETVTEFEDVDFPDFPQLLFVDGTLERLEFWVESEERGSWWDLPGWNISLQRQHLSSDPD